MDHSRAQHVTHRLPWSRDRRLRVADRAIDRGTLESVRECQTLKVRARSCRGETMLKLFFNFMDIIDHSIIDRAVAGRVRLVCAPPQSAGAGSRLRARACAGACPRRGTGGVVPVYRARPRDRPGRGHVGGHGAMGAALGRGSGRRSRRSRDARAG